MQTSSAKTKSRTCFAACFRLFRIAGISENGRSIIRRIVWDIAFFGIALGIYSAYSHARYRSISSTAVIWGAASCVVGGFLYQFFGEKNTLLRSLVNIIFEVIFLVIMVILVVFVKMK